jgi:hypothetical protein
LVAGAFALFVVGGTRLLGAVGTTLWRTFPARAGMTDGLGRVDAGALLASLLVPCAIDKRAAAALVSRTTGAALAFFGCSASPVGFSVRVFAGEAGASETSGLVSSTASPNVSRVSTGSSVLPLEMSLAFGDAAGCVAASLRGVCCDGEEGCTSGESKVEAGVVVLIGSIGSTFSLLLVERLPGVSVRRLLMTLGIAVAKGEDGASSAV